MMVELSLIGELNEKLRLRCGCQIELWKFMLQTGEQLEKGEKAPLKIQIIKNFMWKT